MIGGVEMNLLHLKYAIEIEKTQSINKAAENLYMGQPNLSRAIKELERSMGVKIFQRTSKGMIPTPEGIEFLGYAKKILAQVDQVENLFSKNKRRHSEVFNFCSKVKLHFISICTYSVAKLMKIKEQKFIIKKPTTNKQFAIYWKMTLKWVLYDMM